jgi:hypothetical protein
MSQCVRILPVSFASLVLAGIFVAAASASNSPEKASKAPEHSASPAQKPDNGAPAADVKPSPVVVAKIGDYEITKDDLIERLGMEIRPHSEQYTGPQKPVTTEAVLLKLIAEKAMIMEGRKGEYLKDPILQSYVERQRRQKLGSMVVMDYVRGNLSVSEAEIDQMMKSNPKASREQASMLVQRAKGTALLEQFYKQLFAKFHFKQVKENFAKASQIHERLLRNPAKPRKETWILNSQIRDELTKEEKGIVLATYDGGEVTLRDWFEALGEIVPPRRPTDLDTPEGVERLLDRSLRSAMLTAEAKTRGYDKNPQYVREIRDLEDQQLLYMVESDKTKAVSEPNDAQIKAFFEKNKDWFTEGPLLKVDQIWCKDLAAAQEVKEKLAGGADFRAMKEAYSLEKSGEPYDIDRGSQGLFWDDLWKGEPNQVLGPMKGFHEQGLAWRIVKIVSKTPAKDRAYSDQFRDTVKYIILGERRMALLDLYEKEVLQKYAHELHADRIQGIDPLDVATYAQMKQ